MLGIYLACNTLDGCVPHLDTRVTDASLMGLLRALAEKCRLYAVLLRSKFQRSRVLGNETVNIDLVRLP